MHIYGPQSLHGPQPINSPHSPHKAKPAVSPEETVIKDELDISDAARFIEQARGCGAEVILAEGFTEVAPDIFVTGKYPTREQALVIKTEAGLVVVTGCAHPDPVPILRNIHAP